MKTITRNHAIEMFVRLNTMALGRLDEATLEAAMTNLNALRKVHEDFEALKKELFKRIYGDVDKMEEKEKTELQAFFDMLGSAERAGSAEKAEEIIKACKATYPSYFEMREKEVKVTVSLLNKMIDVELTEVDETAFTKGVVLGNRKATAGDIAILFAPFFAEKKAEAADLSELDELLK